jgi:tetratricopeptide (TPR) repeat protein
MRISWNVRFVFAACVGCTFLISVLAGQATATGTAEKLTEIQRDVAVIKEATKLQLDSQKESLQKDLQRLQSNIDQQDKRIADINAATDRLSLVLQLVGLLITLLAAVTGYSAWRSAGTKAKETAERWLNEHASELVKQIELAKSSVQEHEQNALKHMQQVEKDVSVSAESVKKQLQDNLASKTPAAPTPEQVQALDEQEKILKNKPESEYTFSDWESRAFTAYSANKYDLAANYFLEASKASDVTLVQCAHSLFSRGVMLDKLNRYEDSIVVYDQIIARFGEATEPALREMVARVMVNKGFALGQLKRNEEAIVVYDQVIACFAEATEPVLRDPVSRAMVNKGGTLGRLKRNEEAIAAYDQVIARFGEAVEPALREMVAWAINGLGFILLLKAKKVWSDAEARNQLLKAARSKFDISLEWHAKNAGAIGNLSYVLYLNGQREQAVEPLRRALTLGGEDLYRATITDTETDTVPEDAAFRMLLNKVWDKVQNKQ